MVTKKNLSLASYRGVPHDTRLTYATYAAMQAATGLVSNQVGHIGKVTADNSYWILEQITPWVKWKLFAGEDETRADIDYYVSAASGSASNPGTASLPFDDIQTALAEIPRTAEHCVHIHIQDAGSYTITESFFREAGDGGQIAIDASLIFQDVDAGPYTATGWVKQGTYFNNYGELTVAGTPFTPNALKNKFVRGITGTGANRLVAIISNTADTIRIAPFQDGFAIGDTFKIVEPGADVTVTADIGFRVKHKAIPSYLQGTQDPCRLCMIGLNFIGDINISETNARLQYCSSADTLYAFYSGISASNAYDLTKAIDDATLRNRYEVSSIFGTIYTKNSYLFYMLTESVTAIEGFVIMQVVGIRNTGSSDGLDIVQDCGAFFYNGYVETPGKNCIDNTGRINIMDVYFESGSNCLYSTRASSEMTVIEGNSSNLTHVIRSGALGNVVLANEPTLTGTTGDIYWEMTSTTVAFPTAGNAVTDSRGTWIATKP